VFRKKGVMVVVMKKLNLWILPFYRRRSRRRVAGRIAWEVRKLRQLLMSLLALYLLLLEKHVLVLRFKFKNWGSPGPDVKSCSPMT
jgi:hypothetical protein